MDESIQRANELLALQGFLVINTSSVKTTGIIKIVELLSITDRRLFILNSNGGKIKQFYSFIELTNFKFEKNIVTITFGKSSYSFESNDPQKIISYVTDVVQHFLTLEEQQKLVNINGFRIEKPKQNGISAISRLLENNEQFSTQDFEAFKSILIFSQPFVNLSAFSPQFINVFFKVLPFCPNIKSLIFPFIKDVDPYSALIPFVRKNFVLKHLAINGETSKNFFDFITALNDNKESKLFGLSFSYSNMNNDELEVLKNYVLNRHLRSLEFHRAIKDEGMNFFYNNFLTPSLFESLYILNLSNSANINVQNLLPKVKKVGMLSLDNCGVDIYDIFMNISTFTKIKCLDLSHNRCSNRFQQNLSIQLPQTLDTLLVNNVSFSSGSITPFFSVLFAQFVHGLRLAISEINVSPDEWPSIFDYFLTSPFRSFVSLVWDSNPINSKFFAFLLRSPFFESLSVNSCLKSSSPDSLISLSLFIQSSQTLKRLSCRGSKKNFIGNNLNSFLRMIQSSDSIEMIDLTYSKCGSNGVNQIRDFLANAKPNLKKLVIDGAKPEEAEPLVKLLKLAERMKERLSLSFPLNDVEKLIKNGKITEKEAKELQKMFEINENKSSFFLKPFKVFRYFRLDEFPSYLSNKEYDELKSQKQLIPEISVPQSPRSQKVVSKFSFEPQNTDRQITIDQFAKNTHKRKKDEEEDDNMNIKETKDVNDGSYRINRKKEKIKVSTKPLSTSARLIVAADDANDRVVHPKKPKESHIEPFLEESSKKKEKAKRKTRSVKSQEKESIKASTRSAQTRDVKIEDIRRKTKEENDESKSSSNNSKNSKNKKESNKNIGNNNENEKISKSTRNKMIENNDQVQINKKSKSSRNRNDNVENNDKVSKNSRNKIGSNIISSDKVSKNSRNKIDNNEINDNNNNNSNEIKKEINQDTKSDHGKIKISKDQPLNNVEVNPKRKKQKQRKTKIVAKTRTPKVEPENDNHEEDDNDNHSNQNNGNEVKSDDNIKNIYTKAKRPKSSKRKIVKKLGSAQKVKKEGESPQNQKENIETKNVNKISSPKKEENNESISINVEKTASNVEWKFPIVNKELKSDFWKKLRYQFKVDKLVEV